MNRFPRKVLFHRVLAEAWDPSSFTKNVQKVERMRDADLAAAALGPLSCKVWVRPGWAQIGERLLFLFPGQALARSLRN